MTPEKNVRQQIDAMLVVYGWVVQNDKQFNVAARSSRQELRKQRIAARIHS